MEPPVREEQVPNYSIQCHNVLSDTQELLKPGPALHDEALRLPVGGNWDGQQVAHSWWSEGTPGNTGGNDRQVPPPVSGTVSTFGTWAAPVGSEGLSLSGGHLK